MKSNLRRSVIGYGLALAMTAAVLLVLQLELPSGRGLLLFTASVLAAAWYGGLGPGLLATVLGVLAADYFLFGPVGSLAIASRTDIVWVTIFVGLGLAITAISESTHRGRHREASRRRELVHQAGELRERDERLALALETGRLGSWELDLESRHLTCNAPCKANFGIPPGAAMSFDELMAVVHDEDRGRTLAAFERAVGERTDFDAEFRIVWPDQGARWLIVRGQATYAGDGRPLRMNGVNLDVTQHKRAEEQAANARAQLQLVADSVPALISYVDADCHYRLHNRAYQRWFGRAPDEVNGRHIRDVLGEAAWATIRPHAELALSGQPASYESLIPYQDGGARWVAVTNTPDIAADGRVRGFVTHVIDVTERKQAEKERQEADRRKNVFLATLAHELRNPLAPLRNGLQLLRLAQDDAQSVENARGMMERQLQQMVRLIDDLLDVSRISRNRLELRREDIDLGAAVQSAVEASRPFIHSCGHELEVRLPREPVYLHADVIRLAQVISNLLSNAAKYTNRGGRIRLTVEQADGEVAITVTDTGIGIPTEHLPHIFEMFAQVDSALERSQGGLGIGLALARSLVEMHGGSIEARSAGAGTGSEFTVRLPVLADRAGDAPVEAVREQASVAQRRILVVDDYEDAADTLAAMLGLMGHETATARDGIEAVEKAASFRPEVVLLDIGLPGMNGYEVALRIRAQLWGRKTVLVALTGWGQDEDKRRAEAAGFDVHLTKPVDPEVLQGLLAKWHSAGDVRTAREAPARETS